MPVRKTQEQFIIESIKKHGNKCDYSLVDYINTNIKVKIICPIHGIFEQTPHAHLKSLGCFECTREHNDGQKIIIDKNISYMIGLFQTDGSLSKGIGKKGKFQLELSSKDEDIIYKIDKFISYNSSITKRRKKSSINGHHYNNETILLRICDLNFRNHLVEWGIPYGKKSKIIKPPLHLENLSIPDYIRGLYDGDGSLGLTGTNIPFMSFTTDSDDLAMFLYNYISKLTDKPLKDTKRNKRDDIYNIVVLKEDAVILCDEIYYNGCLSLDRKYRKAEDVKNWERPEGMIISPKKNWSDIDDEYILSHELEESMDYLDRTESSVMMRLWRLEKMGN